MARITVVADEQAVAETAAARVATLIVQAIERRSAAVACLTGGRTPERMYERLARAAVDWDRVHLFWGDERHVPPDHPDSNYGMAHRTLIAHVPIPPAQVHRIRAELPSAETAAREYESEILGVAFDMMLLGLGEDAHIASIYPGSPFLESDPIGAYQRIESADRRDLTPLVAAAQARMPPAVDRITLTPPALLNSRDILMIVAGASKADAVRAALEAPADVSRWPAQLLRAAGDRVEWILDEAAARLIGTPRQT